jgi:hypothetical protein
LLYADDLALFGHGKAGRLAIALAFFWWAIVGVPFKWAKSSGGLRLSWVGLYIQLDECKFGLSAMRAGWLVAWLQAALRRGSVEVGEFAGVLGRLNFAALALEYEKPWLAVLYLWLGALPFGVVARLPWAVRLVFMWLARRLAGPGHVQEVRPRTASIGEAFRSDARAEGGRAWVGGWEILGGRTPGTARWFATEVLPSWALWAFCKQRDPQRTIAALELLGTLLSVMLFSDRWPKDATGHCALTGSSDNLGNTYIVSKMMSTKFPVAPLLIELSEQLRSRGLVMDLKWLKRECNQEADDLSNMETGAFCPSLELQVVPARLPWLALPSVLEASQMLYEEVVAAKAARVLPSAVGTRRGKRLRLRQTDPW